MNTQEFLCYRSGILTNKYTFYKDKIEVVNISLITGESESAKTIVLEEFDYHTAYMVWLKSKDVKWSKELITIDCLNYEASNIKISEDNDVIIYSQMNGSQATDVIIYREKLIGFIMPARNENIVIVENGYEDYTNLKLWNNDTISQNQYNIKVLDTIYIKMRDGILLATDIILPDTTKEIKFPTVLIRTCYNKDHLNTSWYKYCRRGYAVVIQDVRGRESSEGDWIPFANEMNDGDETLNFLGEQSWCDGNIGMIGGSYLGYVQWAAASSGNKYLKALVSQVTAGSPFNDLPRRGGAIGSGIMAWCFMVADKKTDYLAIERDDWDSVLKHRPIKDIPLFALGKEIPFFTEWMKHENNDEFWKCSDYSLKSEKINVPALYVSGWFDDDGPGTSLAWSMNSKLKRKNQRLIFGPWLHKTNSTRKIHDYNLKSNSLRYDLDLIYLKWFDRFLKGINNKVEEEKVQYYMLGKNKWMESKCWPPENTRIKNMYLDLSSEGNGLLSFDKPQDNSNMNYICNPSDPFPYVIDVSENECSIPGNYTELEKRKDVLLYSTISLNEEVSIAGDVNVVFYASSSARDTDFVIRLTDVDENQNSIRLCDGVIRARYRNSYEAPDLLEPNKVYEYKVQIGKIANCFKVGHKIRLQITSGAENLCFPNSNTGENEYEVTSFLVAEQSVYHGPLNLSRIELPFLDI